MNIWLDQVTIRKANRIIKARFTSLRQGDTELLVSVARFIKESYGESFAKRSRFYEEHIYIHTTKYYYWQVKSKYE